MIFLGAAAPHPTKAIFVRLCLTLRKPLKRLERNFKILCSWQSASPVVVESDCHLLSFSLSVKCAGY